MAKQAFFIVGAEGSGTRMLADSFVAAGCIACDRDIAFFLAEQQPSWLVVRRSLPQAGEWLALEAVIKTLRAKQYKCTVLFVVRDQLASELSIKRKEENPTAREDFWHALSVMAAFAQEYEGRLLSYEYFVLSQDYRRAIMRGYGLREPETKFYDGNKQYY